MIILGVFLLGAVVGGGLGFAWMRAQSNSQMNLRVKETEFRFQSDIRILQDRLDGQRREALVQAEQTQQRFENLAQKVLDTQARKLQDVGERNIQTLLAPLKERIQEFEKKVTDTYQNESRERFGLKKEIADMLRLNQQMSQDAKNLTQALKGDSKAQGNWGEIVLERILERSGLREGEEYTVQGRDLGELTDSEGKRLRPDVIINLPEGKHIIVDSKVSLTAYERAFSTEIEEDRKLNLQALQTSIYRHIDDLSGKHYQLLEKIQSPDFVLMFLPIEAVFSTVMQTDPEIFQRAWDKRIVLVSPTTLLATLRTVASLWKQELQNRNALEIARQGGALYDKFVGWVGDLEKMGQSIRQMDERYTEVMSKLSTGKGNLVARVEQIKKLGAKATKQMDAKYLDEAVGLSALPVETPPTLPADHKTPVEASNVEFDHARAPEPSPSIQRT